MVEDFLLSGDLLSSETSWAWVALFSMIILPSDLLPGCYIKLTAFENSQTLPGASPKVFPNLIDHSVKFTAAMIPLSSFNFLNYLIIFYCCENIRCTQCKGRWIYFGSWCTSIQIIFVRMAWRFMIRICGWDSPHLKGLGSRKQKPLASPDFGIPVEPSHLYFRECLQSKEVMISCFFSAWFPYVL